MYLQYLQSPSATCTAKKRSKHTKTSIASAHHTQFYSQFHIHSSNLGCALIPIEGNCSCWSCCMTKGVRMFLALLPLIKSRLTGNVPRASPLLLCVNVELNLQFGCAEYRTLDTRGLGAIVHGVCAQARCDVVWFRSLCSVDIYSAVVLMFE